MEQADWISWVTNHTKTFGFHQKSVDMVNRWQHGLSKYTAEELDKATDEISFNPPRFPEDHLSAIHAAVRDMRAVDYKAETNNQEPDHGNCTDCNGSGVVIVPHSSGMVDGEWRPVRMTRTRGTYYTMGVSCECALGRYKADRLGKYKNGEPRRRMQLRVYEANFPNWREAMAAK